MSKKRGGDPFKSMMDIAKRVRELEKRQPSGTIESGRVGVSGDRFDIESIRLSVNPDELLRQVADVLHQRQATTEHKEWMKAQRERQDKLGIRGGGAPASQAEAAAQIEEILRQRMNIRLASPTWTPEQKKAEIDKHIEDVHDFNKKLQEQEGDAKVAIKFKSGGPFIYTSSIPSDYFELIDSGSKGKWVWARGWGPNRSPSYLPWSPNPDRIIHTRGVTSSWLVQVWLVGG